MADKPNFVLVPESEPEEPPPRPPTLLDHIRALLPFGSPQVPATTALRPRLIFGFDATASREPAWATARTVTDALVNSLPGELDVALAVHGGSMLHTFTDFTSDAENAARSRRGHRLHRRDDAAAADPVTSAVEPRRARGHLYRRRIRGVAGAWPEACRCDGTQGHQAHRAARHHRLECKTRCRGVPGPGAAHRRLRAAVRYQRAGAAARNCWPRWRCTRSAGRRCWRRGATKCLARSCCWSI